MQGLKPFRPPRPMLTLAKGASPLAPRNPIATWGTNCEYKVFSTTGAIARFTISRYRPASLVAPFCSRPPHFEFNAAIPGIRGAVQPMSQPTAFATTNSPTLGSTIIPSGRRTTKYICSSGPLTSSEKQTSQKKRSAPNHGRSRADPSSRQENFAIKALAELSPDSDDDLPPNNGRGSYGSFASPALANAKIAWLRMHRFLKVQRLDEMNRSCLRTSENSPPHSRTRSSLKLFRRDFPYSESQPTFCNLWAT
jgi:hypothetical protein